MEPKNRDNHTILSNADGIVFATQKEWKRLPSDRLNILNHTVISNWVTSCGAYFLLRNICPFDFRPGQEKFILLKIVTDEETGKVIFYEMELDTAETDMIMDTPVALWE